MRAFLIRHAEAVSEELNISDETRWLTQAGRDMVMRVGAHLAGIGIAFDAVLTSPLVRAVQTAELIARATGYAREVKAVEALGPSGFIRAFAADLGSQGDAVAVVGHEPSMSALGATLCSGRAFPSFRKCEVMLVEAEGLVFRLDPVTLDLAAE
jgi:phosphohistidine phosphatase